MSVLDRRCVVDSARSTSTLHADHPVVIAMPLVFYAIGFVAGLLANWVAPQLIAPPQIAMRVGAALLIAGALLAVWGNRTMEHRGASVSALRPGKSLVVTGPFRFTRNPLYVARTLLYVASALVMDTPWPLLTLMSVILLVHYAVVLPEERYLAAKFGPVYENYQMRVRRWL